MTLRPVRRALAASVVVILHGLLAGCALLQPLPLSTEPAPWPPPDRAADRIAAAGLPDLNEQGRLHLHAHLDIFADGESVSIPASLGLTPTAASSLHTHSSSGILHVETDAEEATFTLGALFTLWGVRLSESCIGSYCAPTTSIVAYVDGQPWDGNIGEVPLAPHQQISVVIGEPPSRIPDTFICSADVSVAERTACEGFLAKP